MPKKMQNERKVEKREKNEFGSRRPGMPKGSPQKVKVDLEKEHRFQRNIARQYGRENKKSNKKERQRKLLELDPRGKKTGTVDKSPFTVLSNAAVIVEVPMKLMTLYGVAIGIGAYALQKGWEQYFVDPSTPYHAQLFLTQMLVDAVKSGNVQAPMISGWLNILRQLFAQKTIPTVLGYVTYKGKLDNDDVSTIGWKVPIGPGVYERVYGIGVPASAGSEVNDRLQKMENAAPYTEKLGQDAFSTLDQFMQLLWSDNDSRAELIKKVSSTHVDGWSKDASAFALRETSVGTGFDESGGFGWTVLHEVKVTAPLFSVFAQKSNNTSGQIDGRYPRYSQPFGGDSIFVGGCLGHLLDANQLKFRTPPNFKPIDFWEYFEILCLYMTKLIQARLDDPITLSAVAEAPQEGLLKQYTCPLSFLEVALLYRAMWMETLSDSQPSVQGLEPEVPSDQSSQTFVAYTAHAGTCARAGSEGMNLPLPLAELMKAATMCENHGGPKGRRDPQLWFPVLGEYYGTQQKFDPSTYFATLEVSPENTIQIPTFKTPQVITGYNKKTGQPIYGAEVAINLIDGTTADGDILFINDPAVITYYCDKYNAWVKKLTTYSVPLEKPTGDAGILSLKILPYSSITTTVLDPTVIKQRRRLAQIRDLAPDPTTPYDTIADEAIIAYGPIDRAFWTAWFSFAALPVKRALPSTSSIPNFSGPTRMQLLWREFHSLVIKLTANPRVLFDKHDLFATMCIKGAHEKSDALIEFLLQEAAKGRGGILSSLAAGLGNMLGVPQAITDVVKMVPI